MSPTTSAPSSSSTDRPTAGERRLMLRLGLVLGRRRMQERLVLLDTDPGISGDLELPLVFSAGG